MDDDIVDALVDLMCDDPECRCAHCETLGRACGMIDRLREQQQNLLNTLSICNTLLHIENGTNNAD